MTSFPKGGTASVGVDRQLGNRASCQVAVGTHAATDTASCSLDRQLYLPREWGDEPARCRRAGVPDEAVVRQEKWRLALGMRTDATTPRPCTSRRADKGSVR